MRKFTKTTLLRLSLPLLLAGVTVFGVASSALAQSYTVNVYPEDKRGEWEGWGTSLSWWANAIGGSEYEDKWADLFFTDKNVTIDGHTLPGLNLGIVRYNIGGGGQPGDVPGHDEQTPDAEKMPWYRDIDGFWVNWNNKDPNSSSWDFSRDANQRSMLLAAHRRGAKTVEFFSNAPMWWMMDSQSSAGGNIQHWNRREFAEYLLTVVGYAEEHWRSSNKEDGYLDVNSLAPFNTPSSGWAKFPSNQEGCNFTREEQREFIGRLYELMHHKKLQYIHLAASDENDPQVAWGTMKDYAWRKSPVNGEKWKTMDLLDRVNVHGYKPRRLTVTGGADFWRKRLRKQAGEMNIWVSNYSDGEGSGMKLARAITDDMWNLKPTAWVYWQVLEPKDSSWGLVNANFGRHKSDASRGKITWAYTKYYVMAQFSRFIQTGAELVGSSDHNTIAAYNRDKKTLSFVTVNYRTPQKITYDLYGVGFRGDTAKVTETKTDGSVVFKTRTIKIEDGRYIHLDATANSVYSLVIPRARIK